MQSKNEMRTRKSTNIADINALGMYDFRMGGIESDPKYPYPTLLIYGHKGYAGYLVDIRFTETVYIACAPSFDYSFIWRIATDEESAVLKRCADEDCATIYCLEEDTSGYVLPFYPPLQREPRKFFIVSWGLEITLSYDEVLENSVSNWGELA